MTCGRPSIAREGGLSDRIRRDLEQNILSGQWPAGHRIPSEQELCRLYGCSRMTVSKAVGKLVAGGLVERNRRAGTVVRRPLYQSGVSHISDIGREISDSGKAYGYRCLKQRADHARNRLEIVCLHLADGLPLVHEERMINLGAVHEADHVDFNTIAPGRWLIENVPWSEAENKVSAIIADAGLAGILEISPGSPCLVVERDTWTQGKHLTRVRQVFRGDAYTLVSRFAPAGEQGKQ